MILCIDSGTKNTIILSLNKDSNEGIKKKIKFNRLQGEKMLLEIEKLLQESNIKLKEIKEIKVNNTEGTFTSLRLSVIIANTLAYMLNIPIKGNDDRSIRINNSINIIKPLYNRKAIVDNHN